MRSVQVVNQSSNADILRHLKAGVKVTKSAPESLRGWRAVRLTMILEMSRPSGRIRLGCLSLKRYRRTS